MSYYGYYYYPPSKPRKVRGGIKARAGRKSSEMSWWARHWIAVLDDFDIGERLNRGRAYARKGQARSLNVRKGEVKASVQGSSSWPYEVDIKVNVIEESKWRMLAETLFRRPAIAAKLLAGQMPEDIEKAFKDVGLDLFPSKRSDLETECSCPDWSNPCKHIVAIFFLLAEEFERDPFLIFKLRGTERADLLRMAGLKPADGPRRGARGRRGARKGRSAAAAAAQAQDGAAPAVLPADPDRFWGRGLAAYDVGDVFVPKVDAVLPKQLGKFPFWRGSEDFIRVMEETYRDASQTGMRVFLGEDGEGENADGGGGGTVKRTRKGRG